MSTCVVGRCTTPRDEPMRCYWHGEVLGAFLVLCRSHNLMLADWIPVPEPATFKQTLPPVERAWRDGNGRQGASERSEGPVPPPGDLGGVETGGEGVEEHSGA